MNTTWRHEYLKIALIARKMCQFLKNTKTRIDTGKNTRHDMGKTRTRYGDTNILKLHELQEKCVNF